jgi:polysaccharide biosynthesis protein PslH
MGDILFLAHRLPFPPDRGDKIRSYNILRYLAERRRVHLVAFADDNRDLTVKGGFEKLTASRAIVWRSPRRLASAAQALTQRKPISLTAFDSVALRQAVEQVLARRSIETIYVYSSQMAQYLPPRGRQRVVMDFVDMDSEKFAAYGRRRGPMSLVMQREARLLFQYERAVAGRVDASLFVSEAEAALFRQRSGCDDVHVVENGIDTARFDPDAAFKRIESLGAMIVFTGQMDYRPNIEAVEWFAQSVLPHVRVRQPDARFAIVGRNPSDAVKALARLPGVTVTGEVADVRGWLGAASVVVAPLKLARGVQNKVLEAMAMARPVVATAAAAEGIDHGGTLQVADTVGETAEAVLALLGDERAAVVLGQAARRQVIARYGWDARLAALDPLLGLTDKAPRRRTAA